MRRSKRIFEIFFLQKKILILGDFIIKSSLLQRIFCTNTAFASFPLSENFNLVFFARQRPHTLGERTPFLLSEKPVSALTASPGETGKCAYVDLEEKRVSALTVYFFVHVKTLNLRFDTLCVYNP